MAFICFANSGDPGTGRLAARVVEKELSRKGTSVALYGCVDAGISPQTMTDLQRREHSTESRIVSSRQFINDVRRLGASHDHLLVDLSAASEVMSAIAFSMAELVLVPLRTSNFDQVALRKTFGILETVSTNRRRPLDHAVFMVGEVEWLSPQILVNISGLLMLRGLRMLPVALSEKSAAVYLAESPQADKSAKRVAVEDRDRQSAVKLFVGSVMGQLSMPRSSLSSSA